jgi:hypothetical protein
VLFLERRDGRYALVDASTGKIAVGRTDEQTRRALADARDAGGESGQIAGEILAELER